MVVCCVSVTWPHYVAIILFRQWRPVIISQISRLFAESYAVLTQPRFDCRSVLSTCLFCWVFQVSGLLEVILCNASHFAAGFSCISPSFPVLMNLQSLTLPSCSTVRMVLSTQGVLFAPHMTCCTGVQFESHQSSSIGSLVVTVSSLLLGNSSWNIYQIYELRVCVLLVSHAVSPSPSPRTAGLAEVLYCGACWLESQF